MLRARLAAVHVSCASASYGVEEDESFFDDNGLLIEGAADQMFDMFEDELGDGEERPQKKKKKATKRQSREYRKQFLEAHKLD